ncbi:18463_t:CDS:2 [Funneliformis geosporum]|nr:18463_t:CDS:2 [Funneliformis geosporum]
MNTISGCPEHIDDDINEFMASEDGDGVDIKDEDSVRVDVESFTPEGHYDHSSTLVGNNLYFFGGSNGGSCLNEVIYLDLSQRFNVES